MRPLLIDLFCGLGGWTLAFLDEGWDCIGFDIERHDYGTGGYPGQLVLQDVCTLEGSQVAHADCIVASSPCQEFSYRAMPWKRAKALGPPVLGIKLFWQAFRLQREIELATGRKVPLIAENVRGAQQWIGQAQANYGSFYLWGDISQNGRHIVRAGRAVFNEPLLTVRNRSGIKGFSHGNIRHPDWEHNSKGGSKASVIPYPLAQHIARVYKPNKPARSAA